MRSPSFSSLTVAMLLLVIVQALLFVNAAPSSSNLSRREVSKLPEGQTAMQIQLRRKAGSNTDEPAHLVRSKTQQGNNAVAFDVIGGWKTDDGAKPAIAKTKSDGGEMKKEADLLRKASANVDQLIAYGQEASNDRYWIVMPDVTKGKPPMFDLEELLKEAKPKTKKACDEMVNKAIALTAAASKKWAKAARVLHLDLHPGNVFFDKKMSEAELVDWGDALDYDEELTHKTEEDLEKAIESTADAFFQEVKADVCAKIK